MSNNLVFPRIYLLPTHLEPSELHYFEETVPSLTYDIHEAELVLGKISTRERAEFELRRHKVHTWSGQDLTPYSNVRTNAPAEQDTGEEHPNPKRRKIGKVQRPELQTGESQRVQVLRLSWLTDCIAHGKLLSVRNYLLLEGFKIASDVNPSKKLPDIRNRSKSTIVRRAAEDREGNGTIQDASTSSHSAHHVPRHNLRQPPSLTRQTTSEHDAKLPVIPDFLRTTYSCQRPTPLETPNAEFILELKKIRTLRRLQGDQIGVRAYSTSIATLSAYPHVILGRNGKSSGVLKRRCNRKHCVQPLSERRLIQLDFVLDIERLPGCGTKIAELYQEWLVDGETKETAAAASDAKISAMKLFYDIWGVGDATAREFTRKGWRDLDDLVEYGWQSLTRVQQIGVKFYDEFQQMIPRQEVEGIAGLINDHARRIEPGFEIAIVGGYRRGKKENGDVDVILSHRDELQTMNVVKKLVASLEQANLITHTLSLWTKSSERGQLPLAWKGEGVSRGTGFDTLDKAMLVWQDKEHSGKDAAHRRVDIIISPWKTVGLLAAATSSFFVNTLHMLRTSSLRKTSGVKYPNAYASPEEAEKDSNAYAFNCAQRAHANFTESHTSFLGALLVGGLRFPLTAAVLGASWSLFRVMYLFGYTSQAGPQGRRNGAIGAFLSDFVLKLVAAYTSAKLVFGN
ncbi:DNA polymerase lambda, fingers domain protein [Metarhizium rileyi]|uniref:DNA polymerase n=1 Tax=Metarhizium rileyi (strain RCEF 4871) TaxID=1649241 RepID=A0A167F8L8_METRR|nr:DNA polymerase lambda, fingers domain protein [Metarhizium rileyi RCEF 4871]